MAETIGGNARAFRLCAAHAVRILFFSRGIHWVIFFISHWFAAVAAGERYALVVGVEKYNPRFLVPLDHAEDDMERVGAALQRLGFNVVTMTSAAEIPERRPVSAEDILNEVDRRLKNREPTDTIVLAFSGHGVQLKREAGREARETWFCPERARLDDPATLLPLSQVLDRLKACPAKQKLLLVDACRVEVEPKAIRDKSGVPTIELDAAAPFRRQLPEGMAALFSCGPHQKSFELPDTGGVFTHFVVEYLEGRADPSRYRRGEATVQELAAYVSRQTTDHVDQRLREDQEPELVLPAGRLTDWPLGRLGSSLPSAGSDLAPARTVAPIRLRQRLYDEETFADRAIAISADGALGAVEELDHPNDRSLQRKEGRARIAIWDLETGQRLRTIDSHRYKLAGLAFSGCGTWISSAGELEERVVRVWHVRTGPLQCKTESLPLSLSGKPVFVGTELGADLLFTTLEGNISRLEVGSGHMAVVIHGQNETPWDSAFSSDGLTAIAGYQDHGLRMFDLSAQRVLWETQMGRHDPHEVLKKTGKRNLAPITCVALSRDDRTAVVGWREQLLAPAEKRALTTKREGLAVVATDTGRIVRNFSDDVNRLGHSVTDVGFIDADRAVSCGRGGEIMIWDVKTGRPIFDQYLNDTQVRVSRDGRRLLTSGTQGAAVWDVVD